MMRADDLIITVAYFSIPLQIVVALLRYPRLQAMPFSIIVLTILFALFIFLCGTGHLLRCLELTGGRAFYLLNIGTAFISLTTALYLLPMIPNLFESLDAALAAETESKRKVMTFMSFLCHEIRNPLFAITSTITFMGDDFDCMTREQRESIMCIEQSVDLMLRLVNDVLDISKLESGKLQIEQHRFDLWALVEGMSTSFRKRILQKSQGSVTFEVDIDKATPRFVMGDSVRLLQIAYNLLSNSVKFTERGNITISMDTVETSEALKHNWIDRTLIGDHRLDSESEHGYRDLGTNSDSTELLLDVENGQHLQSNTEPDTVIIRLRVKDTGAGVSPERQKMIFEPYSQAKLSDFRQHGGTGLGLSIVARLIEVMRGSIHVDSELNQGSTFTVCIPVKAVFDDETMTASTRTFSESSLDDLANRHLMGKIQSTESLDHEESKSCGNSVVTKARELNLRLSTTRQSNLPHLVEGNIASEAMKGVVTDDEPSNLENCPSWAQTVLVVDDNAINRKLIGRMLKHFKIEHVTANDGQEAVDFMKKSRNFRLDPSAPDVGLVLMDWSMPIMDGCEATRKMREMGLEVPIVSLTACALEEGLQELLDAGADEIATKPIIREDLLLLCKRYMKRLP